MAAGPLHGPTFYEFFAGGGMARAALQAHGWRCLFANDFDHKKVAAYRSNWGDAEVRHGDVRLLTVAELPGQADLIWASFPCQDLSLAGGGAGLKGNRSGTFWPFWLLVEELIKHDRAPTTVALENVCGTLTSHEGKDFEAICCSLTNAGYLIGALVVDAALFVPQSRPRLFIIGTRGTSPMLRDLTEPAPNQSWHSRSLVAAYDRLPELIKSRWVWWSLPRPERLPRKFSGLVETSPNDVAWHDRDETQRLLDMMSEVNRQKIEAAKHAGRRMVGTIYRRTRREEGLRVQRAEVRFDQVAGCLRTPAGGSSRQILVFVDGNLVRTRLISARETARLMGLPDSYALPARYNEAYHLTGDGVVVPVVEHLAKHILRPTVEPTQEELVA